LTLEVTAHAYDAGRHAISLYEVWSL